MKGRAAGSSTYTLEDKIVLRGRAPVTYILEAYCTEFHKDNPSESVSFTLGNPDPILACILKVVKQSGLSVEATQAAVWIHTDRIRLKDLDGKFLVSDSEWRQATQVVSTCR